MMIAPLIRMRYLEVFELVHHPHLKRYIAGMQAFVVHAIRTAEVAERHEAVAFVQSDLPHFAYRKMLFHAHPYPEDRVVDA